MPDITKQFPTVTDKVEQLRQYLDTKTQPVPPYVLLAGTMDEIPMVRFYYDLNHPEYDAMTDACLLYNQSLSFFDINGNGKPGEFVECQVFEVIQKFVIGRLPTDSIVILDTYFPLLIKAEKKYETNPSLTGMVACAVEFFADGFYYNADQAGEKVKSVLPLVQWTTLYEKEGSYTSTLPADPLTTANFLSTWNKGLDIVFTEAHGGNWRRIFDDTDKDGVYDTGEEHWVRFWGPLTDFQSTTFLGYINGCDTFIDDNWTKTPFPYVDNLLHGKLLNFIGYASSITDYDNPLSKAICCAIGNGFSVGDAVATVKGNTLPRDRSESWLSITIAGDPSARLSSKPLTVMPTVSMTDTNTNAITLSWNKNNPICTYIVQVSSFADFNNLVESDMVYTTSCQISALPAGDYYWRVRAVYDTGLGDWSEGTSFTIIGPINIEVDSLPNEVESPVITVTGSTNADSVKVNGLDATVASGHFSKTVSLTEGENKINIIASRGTQITTANYVVTYKKSLILKLVIGKPTIWVNGMASSLEAPPVITNARTLVPIRAVVEAVDGTIDWDATLRQVSITVKEDRLVLTIGKSLATLNGNTVAIDTSNSKVVPVIMNGRTLLPLRFVAESLGFEVTWDAATQTITLSIR